MLDPCSCLNQFECPFLMVQRVQSKCVLNEHHAGLSLRASRQQKLVGGLEHVLFFHILGRIIPIDKLIFFTGVETTNQKVRCCWVTIACTGPAMPGAGFLRGRNFFFSAVNDGTCRPYEAVPPSCNLVYNLVDKP